MLHRICIDKKYADCPIFDFKFKKVDWELTEENIEAHREEIDRYGVIYVRAYTENDDFATSVIADCDAADGLYEAMDIANEYIEEGCFPIVEVYYTTVCKSYGTDRKSYELGSEFGYVLSSYLACEKNWFDYELNGPVICRAAGEDWEDVWVTTDWGIYDVDIEVDIDALIESRK